MKVNVGEAKKTLSELIKAVESGESVTICRRGVPVAELVATKQSKQSKQSKQRKPVFGSLAGRIIINDPNWWKPMSDAEAEAFIEGRNDGSDLI